MPGAGVPGFRFQQLWAESSERGDEMSNLENQRAADEARRARAAKPDSDPDRHELIRRYPGRGVACRTNGSVPPAEGRTEETLRERSTGPCIVVGVDGSDSALRAVRWAADEAARRMSLRLVTAFGWTDDLIVGHPGTSGASLRLSSSSRCSAARRRCGC